jgi:hypothetical protein
MLVNRPLQVLFVVTVVLPFLMLIPSYYIVLIKLDHHHRHEKNMTLPQTLFEDDMPQYRKQSSISARLDSVLEQSKPQIWVASRLEGRLGNQLFIAASVRGIAKHRNARWCLRYLGSLDHAVQWIERPEPCPENIDSFDPLSENMRFAAFVRPILDDKRHSNVSVGTYLQSFKYFHDNGISFRLSTKLWGETQASQRGINAGIHVRRGDYLTSENHHGLTPPVEYYKAAILHLKELVSGSESLTFFVSSDDISWVKSQDIFDGMIVTEQGRSPEEDMSILAACKHMILSAGTFS